MKQAGAVQGQRQKQKGEERLTSTDTFFHRHHHQQ